MSSQMVYIRICHPWHLAQLFGVVRGLLGWSVGEARATIAQKKSHILIRVGVYRHTYLAYKPMSGEVAAANLRGA